MKNALEKIKALLQWGTILKKTDDSGRDQIAQVGATGGVPFPVTLVYPYGIAANAPTGSNVFVMNAGGSGKSKVGIPQMMENRPLNLKEWEVAISNFLRKSKIHFDDDGNIKSITGDGKTNLGSDGIFTIGDGTDDIATASAIDSYFSIVDTTLTALLTAVDGLTGAGLGVQYTNAKLAAFPPSGEIPSVASINAKADKQEVI